MKTDLISLYLHIPFCSYRCSYCDFNTYTTVNELQNAYAQALCNEINQVGKTSDHTVQTIFFGGGTPSLMSTNQIGQILTTVHDNYSILPTAEITMEINPETVDHAYLEEIQQNGVNRLSFGAQSAIPTELEILGRQHSFDRVVQTIKMAKAAGFEDLSIDLIYGVPSQTVKSWRQSLKAAIALETTHLSLYCLTIEPGTPMQRWLNTGQISPPDPDLAADQYELACEMLAEAGFEHYEISNWSKPGYPSRHNMAYWRNDAYLGLGAGAHGHAGGIRYQVVRQPRVYIRRMQDLAPRPFPTTSALAEKFDLEREDQMAETLMMGLRLLREGVNLDQFEQLFGETIYAAYPGVTEQLVEWGLLETTDNGRRLLLTTQGRFLSNQVFHRYI